MRKKLLLSLLTGVALTVTTCMTLSGVAGSGNITSTNRTIDDVSSISFGGSYKVNIHRGKSPNVTLRGDDNILPLIETKVSGNRLDIKTKRSINPTRQIVLDITVPNLQELHVSGSNDISIDEVKTNYLEIHISGSNSLKASGDARTFKLVGSGSSHIDAQDLRTDVVDVRMSGSVHASVYANKGLKTKLSGSGHLIVYGHPEHTDMHTSGSASVSMK
jgi:hypothetical protein